MAELPIPGSNCSQAGSPLHTAGERISSLLFGGELFLPPPEGWRQAGGKVLLDVSGSDLVSPGVNLVCGGTLKLQGQKDGVYNKV